MDVDAAYDVAVGYVTSSVDDVISSVDDVWDVTSQSMSKSAVYDVAVEHPSSSPMVSDVSVVPGRPSRCPYQAMDPPMYQL